MSQSDLDTTEGFDPTAIISDQPFSDLVEDLTPDKSATNAADIRSGLANETFGQLQVEDFSYFNRTDTTVVAGEFRFKVEQRLLLEALATVGLTTSRSNAQFGAVKVTIFYDRLKVQTFNQASYSEFFLPLAAPSPSIPVEKAADMAVAFIIDHTVLTRIVKTFPEALIEFQYFADKKLLAIQTRNLDSGEIQKDVKLGCMSNTDFTDYHSKLPEKPTRIGRLNPQMLRKAVLYAILFAQKDEVRGNLNLIELRGSTLFGGSTQNIGSFFSKELESVDLKVKFESIVSLEKMLARFNPEETYLYDQGSYFLIKDSALFFGFEKYNFSFPDVTNFFKQDSTEYLLVPRAQLLSSLQTLQAINSDRDMLVSIHVTGVGNDTKVTLSGADTTGKVSYEYIHAFRDAKEGKTSEFADWNFSINIIPLLRTSNHFDSTNVHLEVFGAKALMVWDEEEGLSAKTLLSFLTPEQVKKMKDEASSAKNSAKAA